MVNHKTVPLIAFLAQTIDLPVHTVQSAVLFAQGELVTAEELNLDESGKPSDPDIALKGECMEKKRICQALEKAGHNRKEAARLLGISRSTINPVALSSIVYAL